MDDWKKTAPRWVQEDREMNEAEWLEGPPLIYMVSFVILRSSDRRHLLFGCACCREVWDRLKMGQAKHLVALAEQFADGEISESVFRAGADKENFPDFDRQCSGEAEPEVQLSACELTAINGARWLAAPNFRLSHGAYGVAQETCADRKHDYTPSPDYSYGGKFGVPSDPAEFVKRIPLLRDIFGNPFRPVTVDPRWQTETVVALAAGIYAERAFDRMPILADALEEAGCDHADILTHCRGDGPHVRGCWVVDLLLGKE